MHALDYGIVGVYLGALLVTGAILARRAGQSAEDYFLAGRRLPWWALGSSGMASNLDVAGTTTIVALVTLYGLHGFWIEMRGGVVLPIAVFAAFMGKWHRRSQVMTTAEWMLLRFGEGASGRLARLTAAATYIVITVAMIAFFLSTGGRFLAAFLPFSETQCSLGIALVTFVYTLIGGLYGVIWTDVVQAFLIGAAALYVSVMAYGVTTPELLGNWKAASLNSFVPHAENPDLGPYSAFAVFLAVWVLKGVLEGLGGSGGSAYMAQRFYAASSDRDCHRIGLLWIVLFAVRWPMVLGFALLAMHLGLNVQTPADAERVLPAVIGSELFPPGVRGLILAAMLAAAMSTFDSTINAGASYLVRDVYSPLRPGASNREQALAGYAASALLVLAGLLIAFRAGSSALDLWVGIVMQLFPAFLVPFMLRWFWWRFNGQGFAAGIAAGFAAAAYFWLASPEGWNEATRFLAIAATSLIASCVTALATAPVPSATLAEFYRQIRPFGLWPREWRDEQRREHRRDLSLLVLMLAFQILTFLLPMGVLLKMWTSVFAALPLWLGIGVYLLRMAREPQAVKDRIVAAS